MKEVHLVILSILLLVISLNLDSLGVGIIYGMRKMHISKICKSAICFSSIFYSSISIFIGTSLSNYISDEFGKYLGVCILIAIGISSILKALCNNSSSNTSIKTSLTLTEALFLSFALSIDSIGAGIGFSLIGQNSFFIPLFIGIGQLLFLELGLLLGARIINQNKLLNNKIISILPGILLILLALLRI